MESFVITKEKLLFDLRVAFFDAKRHKSKKKYVIDFEKNLNENLESLAEELIERKYVQQPMTAFIITHPKKREIFASKFRDRIVHHLYYNYLHEMFESTFIYDSYSCIKGKGTSFGIERLKHHIESASKNYTIPCYCLKLDIKSYFMSINRKILLEIVIKALEKFENSKKWNRNVDFELLKYLSEEIIMHDPTKDAFVIATTEDYEGLPKHKTLFGCKKGCGLPIGNLTSQLFSNIYLNAYDQFVKRVLKCKHYGRYVDDSFILENSKEMLHEKIPLIEKFLLENLGIELNKGKTQIIDVKYGVEFLGAFIKPFMVYASSQMVSRMVSKIKDDDFKNSPQARINSIMSRIGLLSGKKSYNLIKKMFYYGE